MRRRRFRSAASARRRSSPISPASSPPTPAPTSPAPPPTSTAAARRWCEHPPFAREGFRALGAPASRNSPGGHVRRVCRSAAAAVPPQVPGKLFGCADSASPVVGGQPGQWRRRRRRRPGCPTPRSPRQKTASVTAQRESAGRHRSERSRFPVPHSAGRRQTVGRHRDRLPPRGGG